MAMKKATENYEVGRFLYVILRKGERDDGLSGHSSRILSYKRLPKLVKMSLCTPEGSYSHEAIQKTSLNRNLYKEAKEFSAGQEWAPKPKVDKDP